ncbi:MAG: hypothetical protein F6K03_11165, partial [Kamptonema sp. SIO4C4]|nr:hypothetical protein [Kamptonema sp. SIO4C4]
MSFVFDPVEKNELMERAMKLLHYSLTAVLLGAIAISPAAAVSPVGITRNSDVRWSEVVDDPFDGLIVYDRNFASNRAYVSSWSAQGIRMTYYWSEQQVIGTRTVWRERKVRRDGDFDPFPIP